MNKIAIEAKTDFLERLSSAPPIRAVSELIWNGLDAGADHVAVHLEMNAMDGLEKIRVKDTGIGIDFAQVQTLFGNLGDSWKKKTARFRGRALHGKAGQGRFKAFSLGDEVAWNTVYQSQNGPMAYTIVGRADTLTNMEFTNPVAANGSPYGTEVEVSGIGKSLGSLYNDGARDELAKLFAVYLSQYPDIVIDYDGVRVDPSSLQNAKKDIVLDDITLPGGTTVQASVTVIEWRVPSKRVIHLCDANGVSLHETEAGQQIRAPGFEFTAYVKSDHFRELDNAGALVLDELHPDVAKIVQVAKQAVRAHFRRKLFEQHSQVVQRWKDEQIYPFEEKEHLNVVEEAERQVFDILAVNVESYLPSFEVADKKSKQFLFKLLAQALRDNPDSVQRVVTEVLNLKPDEQATLAKLLDATSLSNIISSAKTVANRLDFLIGLENLLFDRATKKKLGERDQLHKILEHEAWIFDEGFALSGSEKTLEEVLELHIDKLRKYDANDPVWREDQKQGRVDLMFSRMVQPRHDERDHLVVELKRPSQPINSEILSQTESYAIAVAQDPRFLKEKTRWRFVAVSNTIDDHAKRKANQRLRQKGLVFDDGDLNIQVWAFEWTDIIADARARLQFINKSLRYEASRETSMAYLTEAHAKFIPVPEAEEDETGEKKVKEATEASQADDEEAANDQKDAGEQAPNTLTEVPTPTGDKQILPP